MSKRFTVEELRNAYEAECAKAMSEETPGLGELQALRVIQGRRLMRPWRDHEKT